MISPIGREVDRGGGATSQRQGQQRARADCGELLHKRVSKGDDNDNDDDDVTLTPLARKRAPVDSIGMAEHDDGWREEIRVLSARDIDRANVARRRILTAPRRIVVATLDRREIYDRARTIANGFRSRVCHLYRHETSPPPMTTFISRDNCATCRRCFTSLLSRRLKNRLRT